MKKEIFIFILTLFALLALAGCGQAEKRSSPAEDFPQAEQQGTESMPEPTVEPVNDTPEPIPEPLLQPQADGTGISFMLPDDWNKYPADALHDLQAMIDDSGNRTLYGVLHGFMDSQELSAISLADSSVEDYEYMVNYYLSYDASLDDGTPLRLKFAITGWGSENSNDEIYFDGIDWVSAYPAFENNYWSLECQNPEGWHDWVYQITAGNIIQYYSISEDSLHDYTWIDYFEEPEPTYTPEEPTRLTQYEWPDYCDEIDCLMMEAVGLQYNKTWGTATKLLKSGSLITITVMPKIGGGVEYGANVKVDGITTIPVKSSDGINYQCRSQGGHGGNMSGYYGKWITLTKDGWSNWY